MTVPLDERYEPLSEQPGDNANPTDWVRYAAHLQREVALLKRLVPPAFDPDSPHFDAAARFRWLQSHP